MNPVVFSLLLLASLPDDEALFRNAVPGPEATGAYKLFQSGDTKIACATFVEQVRNQSRDPWAYWGASICAADVPETRQDVLTVLDALPQDAPLVLLTRGHISYQVGELADAEELLRRCVERAPNLALAWHALGVVIQERGDPMAALPFVERALELSPELGIAKVSRDRAQLFATVFDRLLKRLAELPDRWDDLPTPRIPASGRSILEVLSEPSGANLQATAELTSVLTVTPLEGRQDLISRAMEVRQLGEADLWLPFYYAQAEGDRDPTKAALLCEVSLQWAETLGRRDAILSGAALGLDIIQSSIPSEKLQPVMEAWMQLSFPEGSGQGLGLLHSAYAAFLIRTGDYQDALSNYQKAREWYQAIGFQYGLGSTFLGVANALVHLGDLDSALSAYRDARQNFQVSGNLEGIGQSWQGEAAILAALGDEEGALAANREAGRLSQVTEAQVTEAQVDRVGDPGNQETVVATENSSRIRTESSPDDSRSDESLSPEKIGLHSEVFTRLLLLLAELPMRWADLPEPRVPMSGRSIKDVVQTSSDSERETGLLFIATLAQKPLAEREEMISRRLQEEATEVDLWIPAAYVQRFANQEPEKAALIAAAWLQWAAASGRKDVLLFAASLSFSVADLRISGETLLPIHRRWAQLPRNALTDQSFAYLLLSYARILYRVKDNQRSLSVYQQARQLFQAGGDQTSVGKTWIGEADVLFLLGDVEGALAGYREARRRVPESSEGLTWFGEGDVLYRLGDNEGALAAYRRGRQLFQATGNQSGLGETWNGEGKVLLLLGDHEGALSAYREARRLFHALGSHLGQGDALTGEANVLFQLDENQKALATFRQARQHFQAIGGRLGEGNAILGEARVLHFLNDLVGALTALREARQLFREVGDSLGQGNTLSEEADILLRTGELEASLATFREARRLFETIDSRLGHGNALLGEGRALAFLGEPESALLAYREAHEILKNIGNRSGQGGALLGSASVLANLGDFPGALAAYQEAHEHFQAVGSQLGQGQALMGQAELFSYFPDAGSSRLLSRKARQIFDGADSQLGLGNTLFREARVLQCTGRREEALAIASLASDLHERSSSNYSRMHSLLLEIELRDPSHEADEIIAASRTAIEIHSQRRRGYVAEEHRTGWDAYIRKAYDHLIPVLAHQKRDFAAALARAEESHSRVLLDLLTAGTIGGSDAPLELVQENHRLRTELAQIGQSLNQTPDSARRSELLTQRQKLDADLQRNLYDRISAESLEQEFGQPLDGDGIRALANEVGAMILYYAAEAELLAFLIQPSGEVHFQSIDIYVGHLDQQVDEFVFDLSNPGFESRAERQAKDLWQMLLSPFARHLPHSGPITFIPHGPLHGLPFEALTDPATGQRLFERWDVRMSPSASALAFARQRHASPSEDDRFVAFAAGVGLNLPAADARAVARFFPASQQTTFGPAEAEFQFYNEHASQATHLLIATHGVQTQASRRGTYLQIKPTPDVHDERLTAAEIATIPLSAELVTLAACDTDRGDALLSDERLTLTRSFLIAGAASVLATRWRLPEDHSTRRFLVDFYQAYRSGGLDDRGLRKDQALTLARRKAVERGEPAQVWAAWVLVGDAQ